MFELTRSNWLVQIDLLWFQWPLIETSLETSPDQWWWKNDKKQSLICDDWSIEQTTTISTASFKSLERNHSIISWSVALQAVLSLCDGPLMGALRFCGPQPNLLTCIMHECCSFIIIHLYIYIWHDDNFSLIRRPKLATLWESERESRTLTQWEREREINLAMWCNQSDYINHAFSLPAACSIDIDNIDAMEQQVVAIILSSEPSKLEQFEARWWSHAAWCGRTAASRTMRPSPAEQSNSRTASRTASQLAS